MARPNNTSVKKKKEQKINEIKSKAQRKEEGRKKKDSDKMSSI